jgi:heme A synthase
LALFSVALTFGVVVLGVYVRLNDAGLGCPERPGCYGQMGGPRAPYEIAQAQQNFLGAQLEPRNGWIEMVHRAWRNRARLKQSAYAAPNPVAVVIFHAMLGTWIVTLLLRPAIVTRSPAGRNDGSGFTHLACLVPVCEWLFQRYNPPFKLTQTGRNSACSVDHSNRAWWMGEHHFCGYRLLSIEMQLGMANVLSFASLPLAVLHNAFVALLLATLVATNYLLHH